jgi:ABC-type sugar transport system ATPase subunit
VTNGAADDFISVRNVRKHYDGIHALRGARLDVRAGEIHALVGENGAGKSTLGRVMAGVSRADAGDILIEGLPVSIATPRDAQRCGIGIVYQELDVFPHLTVGENLVIGNLHFGEGWVVSPRQIEDFCRPYLSQVGLTCATGEPTASLSIGQRQLLVIARALSMQARVLILDEPTSALSEDAAERLFTLMASLKVRGTAMVYVSHKMDEVFRLSDRITVLRDGETIGTRDTAATDADEIIRLMVGRPVDRSARRMRADDGRIALSASRLTTAKLRDVSFELGAGEILGIAGLVGAGRSALGAALCGLDPIQGGELRINGRELRPRGPADALRRGLGLLPEDRQRQGLMMHMSVLENGTLSVLPRVSRGGFVSRTREAELVAPLFDRMALRRASADMAVHTLSGGNQQKALLARALLADPDVLFLDDPTRGIDVGAKEDIRRLIDELASRGKGILLVSSELPELLRCCDRILVLRAGRVVGVYSARDATQAAIMTAATGPGWHADLAS